MIFSRLISPFQVSLAIHKSWHFDNNLWKMVFLTLEYRGYLSIINTNKSPEKWSLIWEIAWCEYGKFVTFFFQKNTFPPYQHIFTNNKWWKCQISFILIDKCHGIALKYLIIATDMVLATKLEWTILIENFWSVFVEIIAVKSCGFLLQSRIQRNFSLHSKWNILEEFFWQANYSFNFSVPLIHCLKIIASIIVPSTEVSFYASTICANFSIEFAMFICCTVDWSMIHWNEMEKEITWNTQ